MEKKPENNIYRPPPPSKYLIPITWLVLVILILLTTFFYLMEGVLSYPLLLSIPIAIILIYLINPKLTYYEIIFDKDKVQVKRFKLQSDKLLKITEIPINNIREINLQRSITGAEGRQHFLNLFLLRRINLSGVLTLLRT